MFLSLHRKQDQTPPVLVSLDLDGSLIGPDSQRAVTVLNRLHDEGKIKTLINTGNNSDYIQFPYYSHYLSGLKVDTLILRNGQQIYENAQPETQTFEKFVVGIENKPQEPTWVAHLREIWDRQKVVRLIHETVQDAAEACGMPREAFGLHSNSPRFSLKKEQSSPRKLDRFVRRLLTRTKTEGTEAEISEVEDKDGKYRVALVPKGIDKAAALEHKVLQDITKTKGKLPYVAVVTLDDAFNGKSMLTAKAYGNGRIPNYPTLVGSDVEMRKALRGHPRVVFTQAQNVSDSLNTQIAAAIQADSLLLAEG